MSTPPTPAAPMRVAVITPYFKPRMDWLRQCHESVLAQIHPCTHILVADGDAIDELDGWQLQHIRCGVGHADYGDTPRAIGSMSAIGQGFDAITYLDADNWYAPGHIESLVDLHRQTGAAVCTSHRNLHRPDGSLLGLCPETDGESFADTSCIFLTRRAFAVAPFWALMDPKLHAIDDHMIMYRIRRSRLTRAFTGNPTVAYRTTFPGHYKRAGERPPSGAKASTAPMRAAFAHLVAMGGPDLRTEFRKKGNPIRRRKK